MLVAGGLLLLDNINAADITIYDGASVGTGWYSSRENNETEPNTITSQQWDMEAFYLSGMNLTMQGGYNFTTPAGYDGWRPGDLFIDVNQTFKLVAVIGNAPLTYDVYLFGNTYGVYYAQNALSNPWRYKDGGILISANNPISYSSFTDPEGTHYTANLNISWLYSYLSPNNTSVTFHNTMECGNDNLIGLATFYVPTAPEGNMILPSLIAIMGIVGFAIHKRIVN